MSYDIVDFCHMMCYTDNMYENERIRIEQPPKIGKEAGSKLLLSHLLSKDKAETEKMFNRVSNKEYLYWDKAKFHLGRSGDAWYLIRQIRKISSVEIPIKAENGMHFTWYRPLYTDKYLREIDMYMGGAFLADTTTSVQNSNRQKYLARGIVEESIASSQLEGADTASKYAKKMLTEKIRPRNKSEQMIVNNYRVMKKIEDEYKDHELSLYLLQTLQSELTEKTLDSEYLPGELRKDSDGIIVNYDTRVAHVPPKADFVKHELERLVAYANDDSDFIHPVIKAIQLHFWIGYLHPFPDGNGRLARAVFYWYLFRHNYWAIGYTPISMMLKRSQHSYTYAYIYAEQDDYDFTYFYDYNLRCILKAIKAFNEHIEKKKSENEGVSRVIKTKYPMLNNRQVDTLKFLASGNDMSTSGTSYSVMHGVTLRTAYRDLKGLKGLGLVFSYSDGKNVSYKIENEAKKQFFDKNI